MATVISTIVQTSDRIIIRSSRPVESAVSAKRPDGQLIKARSRDRQRWVLDTFATVNVVLLVANGGGGSCRPGNPGFVAGRPV
jgi:hypothetical protein